MSTVMSERNEDADGVPDANISSPEKHAAAEQDDVNDRDDIYCGAGRCRPRKLQNFASMGCFVGCYCVTGLVTSTLNVYINSQITTLEKQFGFSSTVSGFLMSCNDIGFLIMTLFVSYATRRVHIPRFLGFSTLLFGFAGLLCTVPYFVTKDQLHPVRNASKTSPISFDTDKLCTSTALANSSSSNLTFSQRCSEASIRPRSTEGITEDIRNLAVVITGLGMLMQGFGKSPRFPFITTYVDDNVDKMKTSMYMGVIMGISIFGPALAFLLGGFFSKLYVTLEDVNMTPRDPNWIGAWWLGFLVFGGCGVFVGLPLMFFPRRMKPRDRSMLLQVDRNKSKKKSVEAKRMLQTLGRLISNPIFVCLTCSSCTNLFAIGGLLSFLPKYLETQFLVPAWKANMLLGFNVVLTCMGIMTGGCITTRFRFKPMTCLKLSMICNTVSVCLALSGFFIGCPQPELNMGTFLATSNGDVSERCTTSCVCEPNDYFPVCGDNGIEYFSPCHAGCTSVSSSGFVNCSCVDSKQHTASPGLCETKCSMLYLFIAFTVVASFMGTFTLAPFLTCVLRSVPECDKPLGLGLQSFLNTLIGWLPGPVAFGQIVDTTCLIWSQTCAGTGNCLLYDMLLLRSRYHILFVGARTVSVLFSGTAFVIATRKRQPFYDDNKDIVIAEQEILVNGNDKEMTVLNSSEL